MRIIINQQKCINWSSFHLECIFHKWLAHINHKVHFFLGKGSTTKQKKMAIDGMCVCIYIYIYAISPLILSKSKTVLVCASVLSLSSSNASFFSLSRWRSGWRIQRILLKEWVPQVCSSTPGWGRGEAHIWRIFGDKTFLNLLWYLALWTVTILVKFYLSIFNV